MDKRSFLDRIAEKIALPPDEDEGVRLGRKTRWAEIKNGEGKVTGYIELFWGGRLGWVSIPGASRVIEAGSEKIS
jgi:hypothetical protein